MIKIRNKWIPPGNYHCLTVWPFLFYKGELDNLSLGHERWHEKQYLFCVVIGFAIFGLKIVLFGNWWNVPFLILPFVLFYIAYFIGWVIKGYENMGMEKVAYDHQDDPPYNNKEEII